MFEKSRVIKSKKSLRNALRYRHMKYKGNARMSKRRITDMVNRDNLFEPSFVFFSWVIDSTDSVST